MENRFQRRPSYDALAEGRVLFPGNHVGITEIRVKRGYSLEQDVLVKGRAETINGREVTVFSIADI